MPFQPVLAHDEVVDLAGDLLPAVQVPGSWKLQPAGAGGDELHRLAPELGPHLQLPAVLEAALGPLRPPAGDGRVVAHLHSMRSHCLDEAWPLHSDICTTKLLAKPPMRPPAAGEGRVVAHLRSGRDHHLS